MERTNPKNGHHPSSLQPCRIRVLWSLGLLLLAIVSCVETQMTVKQARQITVSLRGKSFAPPPRSIEDILSMLEEKAEKSHATIAKMKTPVSSPAPSGRSARIDFFYRRSSANFDLGLSQAGLAAIRTAYRRRKE